MRCEQGGKVKWSQMPMFVIPTGPGRSRVLWWLIVHAEGLPAPFRLLAGLKPRWVDHLLTRNLVFDGDNIILHMQVLCPCPSRTCMSKTHRLMCAIIACKCQTLLRTQETVWSEG